MTERPARLAMLPEHIPFVKPRLKVVKGDRVALGSPLFEDKRNPNIHFLSPGGGRVTDIRFGPRRVIQEIVIELDDTEKAIEFERYSQADIDKMSREQLVQALARQGGMEIVDLPGTYSLTSGSEEERIAITLQEYVTDALAECQAVGGEEQGFRDWADYLLHSLDRIRRRLGGDRHAMVRHRLEEAIRQHAATGSLAGHRDWIAALLRDYYDGMYEYQLRNKAPRIVFSGTQSAVLDYLRDSHGITSKPS
jgi:hypothetical protein